MTLCKRLRFCLLWWRAKRVSSTGASLRLFFLFFHVQQGGFAHMLIMVSISPHADALRSNVCVSTCWRDNWTRFLKIVVGGRRGACRSYVVRFSHFSRRRCVRHRDMQVTRGATTPSTSITHSASRCAGMCVGRAP